MRSLKFKLISIAIFGFVLGSTCFPKVNIAKAMKVNETKKEIITPLTSDFNFQDLINKVLPSVVTINVTSVEDGLIGTNLGSGFFITPKLILTNKHVVDKAEKIKVTLNDGREVQAKIVNKAVLADLAVIEVTTPEFENSNFLKLGSSSDMEVGEWVFAVGTPFDEAFSQTVGTGIVSGVNRVLQTRKSVMEFIESDVTINAGNSGGPLLNFKGEVVGINTGKIAQDGYKGITISITSDFVKKILPEIMETPFKFGISGLKSNEKSSNGSRLDGVFVVGVEPDTIASEYGIIPGDIILEIDSKNIRDVKEIKKLLKKDSIIKVYRNNSTVELKR